MKKQKLKLYGVRLRIDQIEFLKGLDDAAKVIRELIDNHILTSGKPDIILINKKITILNRRVNEILDSPLYKACKFNFDNKDRGQEGYAWRLMNFVTFRSENVKVGSEEWQKRIDESIDILNSFHAQLKKYAKQIYELQDKLKAFHE